MVTKTYGKAKSKKGVSKSKKTKSNYQSGRELPIHPIQELKAFDVAGGSAAFTTIAAGATLTLLNAVVSGSELFQRVGRKLYMKSLHIKGSIVPTGTASAACGALRILVLYDGQPNLAFPAFNDVLKNANAGAAATFNSHLNLDNRERFKVLRDKWFYMGNNAGIAGQAIQQDGQQCLVVDEFIKLHRIEAVYNATNGGTVADITSGSIILVSMCDAQVTTAAWTMSFNSRLRYWD